MHYTKNKNFYIDKIITFWYIIKVAIPFAGIAQLIERCLAKAEVAGLSPVSRSKIFNKFSTIFLITTYNYIDGDIAKWLRHESAKL